MYEGKTARVVCHNDGKGKLQSYEVYAQSPCLDSFMFDECGYGETQEEALEEYRQKFKKALDELNAFAAMLLDTDALPIIPVDCFGKEIEGEDHERQPTR